MEHLSKQKARKLIVLCNDFHHQKKLKSAQATLTSIQALAYVQIDTISVVNRAHLHVLWSRNHNFHEKHLDVLYDKKHIFEYWSHAAAILPMRDYHFSLVKKQYIANGGKHWHKRNVEMMNTVKQIIVKQGAMKSSDFKHETKSNNGWWDWKPAKLALEQLFMEGELMVKKRQGFQKLYDLTKRILPTNVRLNQPTADEFYRHLIKRYLMSQGIATAEHICYLRKGIKSDVESCLNQMLKNAELTQVQVNNQHYFALPERLSLLNQRLNKTVHILSPFDNMLIQRKRLIDIFDYDYKIECYVPTAKRQFGYFCLPILYGNELVGRIDCKAHRKQRVLMVNAQFQEKTIKNQDKYQQDLYSAIIEFAAFNQCDEVVYKER